MSKSKKWQKANEYLNDLEVKYCNLVWYARSNKDELLESESYEILSKVLEIEKIYKDDVLDIIDDDTNWQHGFNSGMLAAIRLVIGLMNENFEDSIDDFPFLDT